jgi:hypothetical protein
MLGAEWCLCRMSAIHLLSPDSLWMFMFNSSWSLLSHQQIEHEKMPTGSVKQEGCAMGKGKDSGEG